MSEIHTIRTIWSEGLHPLVTLPGLGTECYCGYSWCTGICGHPALVLEVNGAEFKAYSSMVATGPVWQPFRQKWIGRKVDYRTLFPSISEDDELARMWT